MWPCVMGWMSMNATTVSSEWTKLASASPRMMLQKTHSSAMGERKLRSWGGLFGRGRRADGLGLRGRLGRRQRLDAVGVLDRFRRHLGGRRLAVRRRRAVLRPVAPPPATGSPVAPVRPREALHLRPDSHALAGRH